jgi:hypothetical protein
LDSVLGITVGSAATVGNSRATILGTPGFDRANDNDCIAGCRSGNVDGFTGYACTAANFIGGDVLNNSYHGNIFF